VAHAGQCEFYKFDRLMGPLYGHLEKQELEAGWEWEWEMGQE